MDTTVPNKLFTLVLLRDETRILLGMKKRGFGAGKWNGFGGKVEQGELIEAAALRELREESGIVAVEPIFRGKNIFRFVGNPVAMEVHIFEVTDWEGEPVETDEMRPQWFLLDQIPFAEMWADDEHWFPHFFAKHEFCGEWLFEGEKIRTINLELIEPTK